MFFHRGDRDRAMKVRLAERGDMPALADLWFAGWQDAHAAIVPAALTRARTRDSFAERLRSGLAELRVVGPIGKPFGFSWVRNDELNQLFVAEDARGRGIAGMLMSEAETRLAEQGVRKAWLACAIGNERAGRFYEKCGWLRAGTVASRLDTTEGSFELAVWRYEKLLGQPLRQLPRGSR